MLEYFRRHAQVPKPFLDNYASLGISNQEAMFIVHLHYFWWASAMERDPHPSLTTIARKMGCSWRQAHRYAGGLRQKGYLKITNRTLPGKGKVANVYDLEPLVLAVLRLHLAAGNSHLTPMSGPHMTSMSDGHLSLLSHEEEAVQVDSEQEEAFSTSNTAHGLKKMDSSTAGTDTRDAGKPTALQSPNRSATASAYSSRARSQSIDHPTGERAAGGFARATGRGAAVIDRTQRSEPDLAAARHRDRRKSSSTLAPTPGRSDSRPTAIEDLLQGRFAQLRATNQNSPKSAQDGPERSGTPGRPQTPPNSRPGGAAGPSYVNRRTVPTPYIKTVIREISELLHDGEHSRSNVTRAMRLCQAAGLDEQTFVGKLYQARSITRQSGNVKKRVANGLGLINGMPYFFAVVEDLLGMREPKERVAR